MDISAICLQEAERKGAYTRTVKHDIFKPFPFEDGSFGAVTCIGVCSRFDNSEILSLIMEFARVAHEEGVILISHREDLMKSSPLIDEIKGRPNLNVQIETVTEPHPYLSEDENYKDIGVQYIVLRKKG